MEDYYSVAKVKLIWERYYTTENLMDASLLESVRCPVKWESFEISPIYF
jgi:hypothetical protein